MDALTEETPTPELTPETAFEVLSDRRRRAVISHLRDSSDAHVPIPEVIDHVADRMATTDEGDGKRIHRERVAVRFHHVTLPKLANAGVIEHDREAGTVSYRPRPLVDACLDLLAERAALTGTN